jgi:hypothetical protein
MGCHTGDWGWQTATGKHSLVVGQSVIQIVAILVNKDVLLSKDLERGIASDLTADRGGGNVGWVALVLQSG